MNVRAGKNKIENKGINNKFNAIKNELKKMSKVTLLLSVTF